jgi:putative membrane protein
MAYLISHFLIIVVGIIHLYIMYLECVLWSKPKGMKTFRMDAAKAETTKVLAFNQGVYNGFLALALIWGVVEGKQDLQLYGLICVFIAGLVGAATVGKKIFFIQSLPALIALIVFWRVQLS